MAFISIFFGLVAIVLSAAWLVLSNTTRASYLRFLLLPGEAVRYFAWQLYYSFLGISQEVAILRTRLQEAQNTIEEARRLIQENQSLQEAYLQEIINQAAEQHRELLTRFEQIHYQFGWIETEVRNRNESEEQLINRNYQERLDQDLRRQGFNELPSTAPSEFQTAPEPEVSWGVTAWEGAWEASGWNTGAEENNWATRQVAAEEQNTRNDPRRGPTH